MRARLRILLVCLTLLVPAAAADAQVLIALLFGDMLNTGNIEFGLDGGLNWSSQPGLAQSELDRNWHLGFYFDIKLDTADLMLHTGVIVKSSMGVAGQAVYPLGDPNLDETFSNGSVTTRLEYFNVPVMLKYRALGQCYVEGGILLGLLHGATDEFIATGPDDAEITLERRVGKTYHPLDAGLMAGIGYRLMSGNGINLGLRFYQGLIDVQIDDTGPARYNQSLYLAVGIPIGVGK
jgi:hypothetical protein